MFWNTLFILAGIAVATLIICHKIYVTKQHLNNSLVDHHHRMEDQYEILRGMIKEIQSR